MTTAQKIKLEIIEKRKRLAALSAKDDPTDEESTELEAIMGEIPKLETRALAAEIADKDDDGKVVDAPEPDGEERERVELRAKVRVGEYLHSAGSGKPVAGAEAEYNAAVGMSADGFPLHLLDVPVADRRAGKIETRETTDTNGQVNQMRWLDRLFADTAAMHLGVTMDAVAPGGTSHPVTTAGATGAQRGREQDAADAAWTVGTTSIEPTRNSVRAVFTREDALRLPGLEDALRRDLRMALADAIDIDMFTGDDGADETRAAIEGFRTANIGETTLTQANKTKAQNTIQRFLAMVDGLHAGSLSDLKIVASVGSNTLWGGTIANSAAENQTLAQFLMASGISWMTRAGIDAATAAGDFAAYIGLGRGINGAAVCAIWEEAQLIRDMYTKSASGQIALTLHYYWGFKIPRPSSFRRLKYVA